ncbi:MAG: penicillin-binding transpeptidase domain-containing protein [Candidatus Korobacteraceae bacterium]
MNSTLAAFQQGAFDLNTPVSDEPISVADSGNRPLKWITNFDHQFKGVIPARQALAESRNAAAIWIVQQIGIDSVLDTARDIGIHTVLQPYASTALGASVVTLLELANAYRFMASGIHADPYVIAQIRHSGGDVAYTHSAPCCSSSDTGEQLSLIQEGMRGVVRLPSGTAHELDARTFPIPVMGKTGTTNDYRDALFVGSTYGPNGITIAVRIGFDDNRSLGGMETGSRAALPVFREVMLKTYRANLVGSAPSFPTEMEGSIDAYLNGEPAAGEATQALAVPNSAEDVDGHKNPCLATAVRQPTNPCELMSAPPSVIYQDKDVRGLTVFTNE